MNGSGRGRLVRGMAWSGQVAALACVTTGVVEQARRRHRLAPTVTAALGRLLSAAALLAGQLKPPQRILLQVVGDGPVGHLVAEGDASGGLRGYAARPDAEVPAKALDKLDVAALVGRGRLVVVRDLGLEEPYRGLVPLVSGEIAEDVAHYLARSEQTPCAMGLGVLVAPDGRVTAAGGWLVLPMPGVADETLQQLEQRVSELPPVTQLLRRRLRPSARSLLEAVFGKDHLTVLERRELRFRCRCSLRRFEAGLVALGAPELHQLADEQPVTELVCRFCGKTYRIPAERVRALAHQAGQPRVRTGAGRGGWPR